MGEVQHSDYVGKLGIIGLEDCLSRVDEAIGDQLGSSVLYGPSSRMLASGGKRLRPALVVASAGLCRSGSPDGEVSPSTILAAASVELLHVSSLIHDDLIDSSTERRGVPTVNSLEGNSIATLSGDYLMASAFSVVSRVSSGSAAVLAEATKRLCDGQANETALLFDRSRSRSDIVASIEGKTGALMGAACVLGAHSVGRIEWAEPLQRYGFNFGMAFQLVDDVLDLVSVGSVRGKPSNVDIQAGVYTLPLIIASEISESSEDLWRLVDGARTDDEQAQEAREIVVKSGAIEATLEVSQGYIRTAERALDAMPDSALRENMANFPTAVLSSQLEKEGIDGVIER